MRSAYRWGRLVDKVVHGFALPRGSADRLPAEPWFIDQLDTTQGLTVRGWAFIDEPCPDGDYSARFAYNGHRFDRVEYPLERGDVGDHHAQKIIRVSRHQIALHHLGMTVHCRFELFERALNLLFQPNLDEHADTEA